ncbi:hypothetical protein, partial [Pontibacter saemangeumensis]|uniref:hypothetical protein n=1 Tax=Pontibacter saemangeumensis TaxID=1084525 RepID=UPI0031F04E40
MAEKKLFALLGKQKSFLTFASRFGRRRKGAAGNTGAAVLEERLGKGKKLLPVAWKEGKLAYLCHPLRQQAEWGREVKKYSSFSLRIEKVSLPLHPLPRRQALGKRERKKDCKMFGGSAGTGDLCTPPRSERLGGVKKDAS